jgi:hypothetical protein
MLKTDIKTIILYVFCVFFMSAVVVFNFILIPPIISFPTFDMKGTLLLLLIGCFDSISLFFVCSVVKDSLEE